MKVCVIDLETSISSGEHGSEAKEPSNDYYTVIYGTSPDTVTVEHRDEGFKRTIPEGFKAVLENCEILIAANAIFDLSYLWSSDYFIHYLKRGGLVWDVQLAEYLMSGQRNKYASLAELQLLYLGYKSKLSRISRLFSRGIGADKIVQAKDRCKRVFALYDRYAKDDGVSTLKVFAKQYRRAKELNMLPIIMAYNKGLLGVLGMQMNGIPIDVVNCERTLNSFKIEAINALQDAVEIVKPMWDSRLGEFKINSPKHKSAIFFGGVFKVKKRVEDGFYKNGNQKYKTIEEEVEIKGFALPREWGVESKIEGRWKTDAGLINTLSRKCTDSTVLTYCELQKKAMNLHKMASTYLLPFLKFNINGVLYPNYNITRTVTGRLSSSRPNFQNIPASGIMLKPIQGQLVAPEGWVCLSNDYGQLEPWVTALTSKDVNLTQDLLNGVCLHCRAVSWIPRLAEGKTYEEIYQLAKVEEVPEWALKRKKAKAINFKRAYGGGAKGLAEAEDLAVEDVQAVFDAQGDYYNGVEQLIEEIVATISRTAQLSLRSHFSASTAKGKVFEHGIELLPIYERGSSEAQYRSGEYRHFGTYISMTGKRYSFEESGQLDKWGRIQRKFSTTEPRNYFVQGTAADIVMLACYECFIYTLQFRDEIKIVRQIHDEIGFLVREYCLEKHAKNIYNRMTDVPRLFQKHLGIPVDFKFPVSCSVGKNFAELHSYKILLK